MDYFVFKAYSDFVDLVFNPDQNPEEKRAVRQDYRKITRRIEGTRHLSLESAYL